MRRGRILLPREAIFQYIPIIWLRELGYDSRSGPIEQPRRAVLFRTGRYITNSCLCAAPFILHCTINYGTTDLPRANFGRGEPIAQNEDGKTMAAKTKPAFDSVKDAFSPVTDALRNLEVPEAAREFVKKTTSTAKDRAADLHAGSGKVTAAIESTVADSVSEVAKISRNIQQAMYEDAEAFFAGIDRLASARSFNEAFRSNRIWFVPMAKCSCRGRSRPPTISASSSPTAPRPPRTIFPRCIPGPPDRASPDHPHRRPALSGPFFGGASRFRDDYRPRSCAPSRTVMLLCGVVRRWSASLFSRRYVAGSGSAERRA